MSQTDVIHAVWLGEKMPPLVVACFDDWSKQNYKYKLWTEKDPEIISWIDGCDFARNCYERGLYAFVTDYLRLKILQKEGGLYLDTDVTIRRDPFPLFSDVKFSVGYETESFLGNAIIFSLPDSIILESLIFFYENEIMDSPLFMGPEIISFFLLHKNLKDKENCFLAPRSYFYSYLGDGKINGSHDDSFLVHWFQHSWKSPKKMYYLKSKHLGAFGVFYHWQKKFFRF